MRQNGVQTATLDSTEESTRLSIREFLCRYRQHPDYYTAVVEFLMHRVMTEDEKVEFERRHSKFLGTRNAGTVYSRIDHNNHGATYGCHHCRFELAEVILLERYLRKRDEQSA